MWGGACVHCVCVCVCVCEVGFGKDACEGSHVCARARVCPYIHVCCTFFVCSVCSAWNNQATWVVAFLLPLSQPHHPTTALHNPRSAADPLVKEEDSTSATGATRNVQWVGAVGNVAVALRQRLSPPVYSKTAASVEILCSDSSAFTGEGQCGDTACLDVRPRVKACSHPHATPLPGAEAQAASAVRDYLQLDTPLSPLYEQWAAADARFKVGPTHVKRRHDAHLLWGNMGAQHSFMRLTYPGSFSGRRGRCAGPACAATGSRRVPHLLHLLLQQPHYAHHAGECAARGAGAVDY